MTHSEMVKQRVAAAIKQYMDDHDIAQDKMAERLGVHQTAVSAYAQQRTMPKADVFLRMVRVLNLDPTELVPGESDIMVSQN